MSTKLLAVLSLAAVLLGPACSSPEGATNAERRAYAESVRAESLPLFYEKFPEVREAIESAPGYIWYSNFSMHPGLLTFANGYGMIHDNATGEDTHMRMFRFGIGPGLSVKGLYALAVIHDAATMEEVKAGRWANGGYAEASFVFGDFGGAASSEGMYSDQLTVYGITHTGVSLEVAAIFSKHWQNVEIVNNDD